MRKKLLGRASAAKFVRAASGKRGFCSKLPKEQRGEEEEKGGKEGGPY